jgi:hypothetical protein
MLSLGLRLLLAHCATPRLLHHTQVPRDLAKVAIESGYYHLKAANVTAEVRRTRA